MCNNKKESFRDILKAEANIRKAKEIGQGQIILIVQDSRIIQVDFLEKHRETKVI